MTESFKPHSEQQPNTPDIEALKEMSREEREQFLKEADDGSLPKEVAFHIIDALESHEEVACHMQKFIKSDEGEITHRLIQSNAGIVAIYNAIENFPSVTSDRNLAMEYAKAGGAYLALQIIDKFTCITADDLLPMFMEQEYGLNVIMNDLKKFSDVDHSQIFHGIIQMCREGKLSINNAFQSLYSYEFKGLSVEDLYTLFSEGVPILHIINGIRAFNLPPNVADILQDKECPIPTKELLLLDRDTLFSITKEKLAENTNKYRLQVWKSGDLLDSEDQVQFDKAAAIFGGEKILNWWGTDEMYDEIDIIFPNVLKLQQISGLEPTAFMGEVLEKQKMDGAVDLREFNAMIEGINLNYQEILERAGNSTVTDIRKYTEQFENQPPFLTWQSFKKYYEFNNLLANQEVLEKLEELRIEGEQDPDKANRHEFFKQLAFHKDSKVSMEKVFQLLDNPAEFLEIGDEHAIEETERKKPSNYTQFDHLDLTAEDLRDALTDGVIDKLAFFPSASKTIEVTGREFSDKELIDYVLQSLGSREVGNANRQLFNALFGKQEGVLKPLGININTFKETQVLSSEARQAIESLFGQHNFNDPRKKRTYQVTVFPPSDPKGHLAGNDTACCMPFGSGKNNVYTFNPTCAQLVVQEKRGDKLRTVAQSVLTPDIDIKHPVPELLSAVKSEREQLHEIVTDNVAGDHEVYITADNIEVAPNAREQAPFIENAYRSFLVSYKDLVEQRNNSVKVNDDFAVVGTGYSDAFNHLQTIENTFVPVCPPSYSDNTNQKSYQLTYQKQGVLSESKWSFPESREMGESIALPRGIALLKPQDSLAVSYIEGKVYADNESLMQYIHRMSNEIIAASIKNTQESRPNLMMKAVNDSGDMRYKIQKRVPSS